MGTFSSNILPNATGLDLGSASQAWDAYINNLTLISGGSVSLGSAALSTSGAITSTAAVTGQTLVSTVSTGTAPLTVTSTTVVPNLNASLLLGSTWASPGSIGATTPAAGAFTTLSTTGAITSGGSVGVTGAVTASTSLNAGTSKFTVSSAGIVTAFNNISTVGNGLASEVAAVNLTAQTAAVGTTTLYAVPAAGQYRLHWNAKVTTPATTGAATSTLGALTIVYTDPDGVAQTITAGALTSAGAIATTSATNTTTAVLLGVPLLLNCKASTNITYAMAYASNTANEMNYNLHISLESL